MLAEQTCFCHWYIEAGSGRLVRSVEFCEHMRGMICRVKRIRPDTVSFATTSSSGGRVHV